MHVSIAEAKARFAEIIRRAESGEDIILTRHGRPVAHLTPAVRRKNVSLLGACAGQIRMAEDFDDLPDEFMQAFTSSDEPT